MPKFVLLGGKHTEADGTTYNAGDGAGGRPKKRVVIDSPDPLDEMFRGKFERLNGVTKDGPAAENATASATDDPPAAVRKKLEKGKAKSEGYRPNRNTPMTVRRKAEIMDEETDDEGNTEESLPPKEAMAAKAKKAEEESDEPEPEETEAAEPTEGEDDETVPAPTAHRKTRSHKRRSR